MIGEIKFYLALSLSIILLTLLVVTKAQLWESQNLLEAQRDEVQTAKNEKIKTEAEQKQKYDDAQSGYDGAIAILNDRLRNVPSVSRCEGVQVAAGSQPSGSVPEATADTEVTYIDLKDHRKVISRDMR